MHRYPALVSGTGNGDASIATALNAVAGRRDASAWPSTGVSVWPSSPGTGSRRSLIPQPSQPCPSWARPRSQPIASHHSLVQPCSVVDGPSAELEPRVELKWE